MGLQPVKTVVNSGVQVWQKVLETAQGGFTLDNTGLADGLTIPAGTLVGFDESTRKASVLKTATMQADATNTATALKVLKGSAFAVGDYVASAKDGAAYAISAIDTSNADYDQLTVGTTLGVALSAGDVIFQSSATGATSAAYKVTPKGATYADCTASSDTTLSVVLRGTLYGRRAPGASAELQALVPLVIFSQSF